MKEIKYIQARHWDYWFSALGLCSDDIDNVELKITNTENEDDWFFFIDFYNIAGLKSVIKDVDIPECDNDIGQLEKTLESFERGKFDHFISGVYFDTKPILDNSVIMSELDSKGSLLEIKPRTVYSTYAVIFVNESGSLIPEVLCEWMSKLSLELFGCEYEYRFTNIPKLEDAAAAFEDYRNDRREII